jgi:NADPH-dependent F420 reductase
VSSIGIIGGTGPQGRGLAYRFATAGHDVVLGSRERARAEEVAADLAGRVGPQASMTGALNRDAADAADVVVVTVPWDGYTDLIDELADILTGKIVVVCVNPLGFDKRGPYGLDLGPTSAAEYAQEHIADAQVVGAFHHLSAATLASENATLSHEDVLVCGDDDLAKTVVMDLCPAITGKVGIDAGPLRLARQLEPLTAVLISINKKYKVRSGVAIAGLDTTTVAGG